jgi:hypothetical protein
MYQEDREDHYILLAFILYLICTRRTEKATTFSWPLYCIGYVPGGQRRPQHLAGLYTVPDMYQEDREDHSI